MVSSSKQRLLSLTHYLPYTCTIKGQYPYLNNNNNSPLPTQPTTTNTTINHFQQQHFLGGDENSSTNNGILSPPSPLSPSTTDTSTVSTNSPSTPQQQQQKPEWSFRTRRGHSALFAGIRSLDSEENVIHLGYVGDIFDEAGNFIELSTLTEEYIQALKSQLLKEKSCVPILLKEANAVGHYEGYCKNDLWPLFHYILWDTATDGRMEQNNWDHYVTVNKKYAEAIAEMHQPGDLVWIHDYHLLLAPSMIRALVPNALIAFFLHAPFPSSEIFRCLPKRQEVLEGVLGANLIGFQTYAYARHFISSCTRVLGLESTPKGVESYQGLVAVGIFPIGIDVDYVERKRKNIAVKEKIAAIREMYAGKKIIIGRDKLDQIKGVHQKLLAFEKFLQEYPEWRGRVVLIQVTSPPQRHSPKLEAKVSELVSRINGTYGSLEFAPVHHYHQHIDRDEYFALLSVADIGLITSVRDGMNTTSHEFVVCQQDNQGPLILSEFTGTAGSLSSAIQVNPWDYLSVADAIEEALTMTAEEKEAKHKQLFGHVTQFTAQYWAQSFVKEARDALNLVDKSNTTPYLDLDLVAEKYRNAKQRLLMFDYDGTLTPIRKLPKAAVPPENMLAAISRLAQDPKNVVFVISGRDQPALDEWLGHVPNLGLSAEHGCFIKYPSTDQDDESGKWINLSESIDLGWKNDVIEIFTYYTERTQGSFIEHKRCSLTWHYRLADPEYGHFQAKECQNHLENAVLSKLPVEILVGKKNLEVRPVSINKGEIVKRLLAKHSGADFVFCAGDDKTDEDMFKALRHCTPASSPTSSTSNGVGERLSPGAVNGTAGSSENPDVFTVTIGSATKMTLASWHVQTPADLIGAMEVMADQSKSQKK